MKNIFRVLILFATITMIFSCETDKFIEVENDISKNAEFQRLYDEILAVDDLNEQKIILSTFDSETQSSLWQIKLDNFVANNDLNRTQLEVINELKNIMISDNFTKIKNKDNLNLKQRSVRLKQKVINSFDENIGWYLLNKFENINQTLAKIEKTPKEATNVARIISLRACECEPNDSCARLTGISIWGLSWEYGDCGGECYTQTYFFGLYESDDIGRCAY